MLCLIGTAGAMGSTHYALDWNIIGGGGGGGGSAHYRLQGTVGQIAGPLTSPSFTLQGGFWAINITSAPAPSPPVASFTAVPGSGNAPLHVQFNDTSTGGPTMWNWSFGDGTWFNTTSSALRNATKTFANPNTYTARLTVSNADGSDTTMPGTIITVTQTPPSPPVASFTATPSSGTAPLHVQFNDTSTGNPTMWNWSYGDGSAWFNTTNPLQRNVSHQYLTTGSYLATLVVGNSGGTSTANRTIQVTYPAPTIASISPAKHKHDKKTFPVTIQGTGFQPMTPGTNVSLKRAPYPEIRGTKVNATTSTTISCYFKISKKVKLGFRNVTVANPDGQMATLVNGFRIKT